jgi:plastocyanin
MDLSRLAFSQNYNNYQTTEKGTNISNITGVSDYTSANNAIGVSIVSGASALTNTAYSPDPIQINTGQTVVWTNDDSTFHTVTSGQPGQSNVGKLFDSGLAGPTSMSGNGKTFELTFVIAGEYPYYCILHPGMIGMVIVI